MSMPSPEADRRFVRCRSRCKTKDEKTMNEDEEGTIRKCSDARPEGSVFEQMTGSNPRRSAVARNAFATELSAFRTKRWSSCIYIGIECMNVVQRHPHQISPGGWVGENEQPDGLAAAAAARCSSWASVSSSARVSFRTQMSLRCVVIIQLVVPSRGGRMTPRNVDGKLVYPPPSRDSREVIT